MTAMTPRAFRSLFAEFAAPSWRAWNAIDDVLWGQPTDDAALVRRLTGRSTLPTHPSELWCAAGRGGVKSRFAGRICAYGPCGAEHWRVAGESHVV